MSKLILILLLSAILSCSSRIEVPKYSLSKYRFVEWSSATLIEILDMCRKYIKYKRDVGDYFNTYCETLEKGYGDCDDYGTFMMGTLKRLGYPWRVRLSIVYIECNGFHVVLKVERPDGCWMWYDTTGESLMKVYYRDVGIEFDYDGIYFNQPSVFPSINTTIDYTCSKDLPDKSEIWSVFVPKIRDWQERERRECVTE